MSHLEESDLIFIPQVARGQPIAKFPLSVRLAHILQSKDIQLVGDLHGLTFSGFAALQNCGQKTLQELGDLVRTVQLGQRTTDATPSIRHGKPGYFFIPTDGSQLSPFELPISRRLERVLRSTGVARLGDLQGVPFSELLKVDGCGRKAIEELVRLLNRAATGEFWLSSVPFSPSNAGEMLFSVDRIVEKLPLRNREILLLRFGATDNRARTLEEIGSTFKLTREHVRQIVERALLAMQREGGPRLADQLKGVAATCREMVCPLTPGLLSQWLGQESPQFRFSLGFYVRLITALNPNIPGWPKGQEPSAAQPGPHASAILNALRSVLERDGPTLPLKRVFEISSVSERRQRLSVNDFLEAVKSSKTVVVEVIQPDQPQVRLRYLRLTAVAKSVLEQSEKPLTPEEILSRAKTTFGGDLVDWDPRTLGNGLIPEKGFYLLGPRAYGLRQHFKLPQSMHAKLRAAAQRLLATENRPISTTEIVNERKVPRTEDVNAYELAQILREDTRFVDLGRFLFALTEWGIEEREYVKDLIPKILAEAGRPLRASQILERLQRLRSTSPSLISAMLRKHHLVRYFGFAHYGLHSWGESVKATMISDAALIERIIRRSEPPLTFSYLCELLNVAKDDQLAAKLWQTCVSVRQVIRSPDECTPTTLLLHKSCSLERALVATARGLSRPLPLYEFQWELNARFGPLFAQRSNAEIRRCLEQSHLFLRNADGEFILDIHLDQLGLDEEGIRQACLEILSDANEIVGCDDLIERLEAEGKIWEELSPDILGSLLREDNALREIRFI